MNMLDWICVAVLVLSMLSAAAQGLMMEIFHLVGVILGYILAVWEGWRLAPWFEPYVKSPVLAKACGGIVVFMAVMIVAGIAGKITRWAMQEVGLRWFDRFMGGTFGLVRGIALCTIGVMALATVAPESHLIAESKTGSYFLLSGRMAAWFAPEELRAEFRDGMEHVRKQQQEMMKQIPSMPGVKQESAPESKQEKPSENKKLDVQSKPVRKT